LPPIGELYSNYVVILLHGTSLMLAD